MSSLMWALSNSLSKFDRGWLVSTESWPLVTILTLKAQPFLCVSMFDGLFIDLEMVESFVISDLWQRWYYPSTIEGSWSETEDCLMVDFCLPWVDCDEVMILASLNLLLCFFDLMHMPCINCDGVRQLFSVLFVLIFFLWYLRETWFFRDARYIKFSTMLYVRIFYEQYLLLTWLLWVNTVKNLYWVWYNIFWYVYCIARSIFSIGRYVSSIYWTVLYGYLRIFPIIFIGTFTLKVCTRGF